MSAVLDAWSRAGEGGRAYEMQKGPGEGPARGSGGLASRLTPRGLSENRAVSLPSSATSVLPWQYTGRPKSQSPGGMRIWVLRGQPPGTQSWALGQRGPRTSWGGTQGLAFALQSSCSRSRSIPHAKALSYIKAFECAAPSSQKTLSFQQTCPQPSGLRSLVH